MSSDNRVSKIVRGSRNLIYSLTFLSLTISMIVMGTLNKKKCVDKRISTWLVVNGSSWALQIFGNCFLFDCTKFWLKKFRILCYVFDQVWILFASFWIYSLDKQDVLKEHSQCYNFSFGMVTFLNVCYILLNSIKFYKDDLSEFDLDDE